MRGKMNMTALYSILHLLVDGLCAMAMFGKYIPLEEGYFYILLYNFCAFALQMPFGVLLDAADGKGGGQKRDFAFLTAAAGVLCTIIGAVTHPVLLGIGNALFHVGGGVGTIREDHAGHWRGRGLGFFVAPGALGLYLGRLIAVGSRADAQAAGAGEPLVQGSGAGESPLAIGELPPTLDSGAAGILSGWFPQGWKLWYLCVGVIMLLLLCAGIRSLRGSLYRVTGGGHTGSVPEADCALPPGDVPRSGGGAVRLAVCCLLVVILRSYIGMAVTFPWKTGIPAGALSVLAVAGGKALGGLLGAWRGAFRTAAVSLTLAAICFLFSGVMSAGLAALLLFNMTMPITLYRVVCAFPKQPGLAFGSLTFALFLGFLPVYFGWETGLAGNIAGCMGSVLSLLLLAAGLGSRRWNEEGQREREGQKERGFG